MVTLDDLSKGTVFQLEGRFWRKESECSGFGPDGSTKCSPFLGGRWQPKLSKLIPNKVEIRFSDSAPSPDL